MSIRRINYSNRKKITSQAMQENSPYLWIAYAINEDDNCIIEKQFAFDPSQTYFSIEREVNNIPKLICDTTKCYVAYDDDDLLGEIFSVTNPLTSSTEIELPIDVFESPVDVQVDDTDLWFLIPGNISSSNTKLLRYTTSGVYVETITLDQSGQEVTNASSMVIEENGDIQINTNTDPAQVIRVFALSGGGWDYQVTDIV